MIVSLLAVAADAGPWQPGGPDLLRTFGGLGLVLALLLLLAWLVRRGTLTLGGPRPAGSLKVESAVALGERRSLIIVAVEGRRLLLGLTPAHVSMVTELAPQPPGFAESLRAQVDGGVS